MGDKISTSEHNVDILLGLGFQKVRNTTLFQNGERFILSPAVSENTNGKYWFDVREVNLNRINDDSLLLVRIVPDLFIVENLIAVSSLFSKQLMDNRPHSGNVWATYINMNKTSHSAFLFNTKKPGNKISIKLLNREKVTDFLINIFGQGAWRNSGTLRIAPNG